MTKRLLIGQVSTQTGLSIHSLRYYEREGLLPGTIERTGGGKRTYSTTDVEWLRLCTRFRSIGMPVDDIRQYAHLVATGPGNERARLALLRAHEQRVRAELTALTENLAVIESKTRLYEEHVAAGDAGTLWTGTTPSCLAVEAAVSQGHG